MKQKQRNKAKKQRDKKTRKQTNKNQRKQGKKKERKEQERERVCDKGECKSWRKQRETLKNKHKCPFLGGQQILFYN